MKSEEGNREGKAGTDRMMVSICFCILGIGSDIYVNIMGVFE